jgi:hypothetical protein
MWSSRFSFAETYSHFLELELSIIVSGLFHLLQFTVKVDHLALKPAVLLVVEQTAPRFVVAQTPAALFQQSFKVFYALGLMLGICFGRYLFVVQVEIKIDNQRSGLFTKTYLCKSFTHSALLSALRPMRTSLLP